MQKRSLAALPAGPVAHTLIRTAKRMVDRARVDWTAIIVTWVVPSGLPKVDGDALAQAWRLADRLGAKVATLHAAGPVAHEILDDAWRHDASRILLARTRPRPWWRAVAEAGRGACPPASGRPGHRLS